MGRTFRIKLRFRRFGRRHPWLTFTLRSFMIFSVVFGGAFSLVACYQGYNAQGGAKGVGVGTTRAVVGSFVTILILDYFLTDVILVLQNK